MFKIFRSIRRLLLSGDRPTERASSRAGKYLLYAIGEIVLVVIGILIALQINNWNQERIDNSKEKNYLINIQKELAENTLINERMIINRMDTKMKGLLLAKKFCETKFEVTDTLELLNGIAIGGLFSGGFPLGIRNYYDELLNTGNLQLIKNDSLKNDIAAYYARIAFYTQRSNNYATQYAYYTGSLRPYKRDNPDHISKYDQAEMLKALQTDEFRRLVDAEISYADGVYDGANSLVTRAQAISELIDKEIGND